MPLYEYKCDKCGNLFEIIQRFSDEPLKTHQDCGGAVHRQLSAPALQFKGSGWYITDYAKGGGAGKSESGKSDAGKSNGEPKSESSSSKSESSPAKTPGTTTSSSDKK
jgi:putative FmdB family regulatory protein